MHVVDIVGGADGLWWVYSLAESTGQWICAHGPFGSRANAYESLTDSETLIENLNLDLLFRS